MFSFGVPNVGSINTILIKLQEACTLCNVLINPKYLFKQFPWMLNMEPYTVSGMARQDSSSEVGENSRNTDQGGGGSPRKKVAPTENYELVGVIVHSGQAHAGHYYSFIKDRR